MPSIAEKPTPRIDVRIEGLKGADLSRTIAAIVDAVSEAASPARAVRPRTAGGPSAR